MWAALIPAIISGIAAIAGGVMQKRAMDEAAERTREISDMNARNQEAETQEALRRQDKEDSYTEGMAKARAAASGVLADEGSTGTYLDAMARENATQREWTARSGANQADIISAAGASQADSLSNQGNSSLIAGVGGAATSFGTAWERYETNKPPTAPKATV